MARSESQLAFVPLESQHEYLPLILRMGLAPELVVLTILCVCVWRGLGHVYFFVLVNVLLACVALVVKAAGL